MLRTKKSAAMLAAAAALVLLITGTFAWQQMISKTNEFIGSKETPTLHDDFNPATGIKDVYVENTAERALFVRVMLDEYMDLTTRVKPASPVYTAHTYGTAPGDCGNTNAAGIAFHNYFTWTMGGSKWYMQADGSSSIVGDTTLYTSADAPNGAHETPTAQIIRIGDFNALPDADKVA
ncbi:MAG: hypothetical protein LBT36_04800, partial [Oscillospiraceae bacterium]|nr:hypothetical protein [Oscillospiraceae bacterium]